LKGGLEGIKNDYVTIKLKLVSQNIDFDALNNDGRGCNISSILVFMLLKALIQLNFMGPK
jgi:hypothetical protein